MGFRCAPPVCSARGQLRRNSLFLQVWFCSFVATGSSWFIGPSIAGRTAGCSCALCIVKSSALPTNNCKKNPSCAVGWFVLKTEGQSHLGSRNSPLTFCPLPVSRLLVFWCVVVCCSFPSLLEPDPSGQSLCEVYLTKKPEFLVVSPLSSFSKFH